MTTHHRITSTAAVALALAAGAAPASALPTNLNAQGSEVPAGSPSVTQTASAPASSLSPWAGPLALSRGNYSSVTPSPTIVRVSPGKSGFDWGDAGIGAGGGLALAMVGIGGALALSGRRTRRSSRSRAITS